MEIQCGSKDEMLKVILVLLFATTILCNGNVTDDCALQNTKSEQPINQLANVVRFFNTTELCDHNCNASTWIDDYGSVQISFTTNLKTGENPDDLCDCMHNYINQNRWLLKTDHKCHCDCDTLSIVLIGPPIPDNDPKVPAMNEPVAALSTVLTKFPTVALGGYKCRSTFDVQADCLTHLLLECELTCQLPNPKKACQSILAYLNQNHWLDNTKRKCSSQGPYAYLEIAGK